jgi:2-amino-4-hydroxy-6-hydroxymethyldihydropteridine diphosphokinase
MTGIDLLGICKTIEDRIGREASGRWMDRVIDLDILLYGEELTRNSQLELPHPGLLDRAFALVPAAEIGGDLLHPELARTLRECPVPRPSCLVLWGCL